MFVVRRKDNDVAYLIADESSDEFNDGEVVGVYELIKTATKRVRHSVE